MAIPPPDHKYFEAESEYRLGRLRKGQSIIPLGDWAFKPLRFLFVLLALPIRLTISWIRQAGRGDGG